MQHLLFNFPAHSQGNILESSSNLHIPVVESNQNKTKRRCGILDTTTTENTNIKKGGLQVDTVEQAAGDTHTTKSANNKKTKPDPKKNDKKKR